MIKFDIEEIKRVTKFIVKKYHLKLPKNMTIEDFYYEVLIFLFFNYKDNDLDSKIDKEYDNTTIIAKCFVWTRAKLLKESIKNSKEIVRLKAEEKNIFNDLDYNDEVKNILSLPLNDQDRRLIQNLLDGLTGGENARELGISRQVYLNKKKSLFGKIQLILGNSYEN